MHQPVHSDTRGGFTVHIYQDSDPSSPRENDNLGTILYMKGSKYILGDKDVMQEEMDRIMRGPNYIKLPVFAYIHGGVALSTVQSGCFSDPWDAGRSGLIYVSKEDARKNFMVKRLTAKHIESIYKTLAGEIETFSKYLNGEVYGYDLLDKDGESIDSCWGFYDEPKELAEEVLNNYLEHEK